jgi:hypothetical protein
LKRPFTHQVVQGALLLLIAVAAAGAELPIGRWLQPAWTDISPDARIFLVAGARDNANFAQEVVDQKKHWLARGYAPNQIECFYAIPPPQQRDDSEQFLDLAEDLRECHLASPQIIFAALESVARNYRHDFLYLYVSSHGTGPLLERDVSEQERRSPGYAWFVAAHDEAKLDSSSSAHEWLSPYLIEVEGAGNPQGWDAVGFMDRFLHLRANSGLAARELLFTPRYLAEALQKFPASVRKFVVLQACHSGGFLLPADEAPAPEETLVTVRNITVLAAARADRTSFGCASAERTTYYGGAFQEALNSSEARSIAAFNWRQLHEKVAAKVEDLEAAQEISRDERSLPQFFSNMSKK